MVFYILNRFRFIDNSIHHTLELVFSVCRDPVSGSAHIDHTDRVPQALIYMFFYIRRASVLCRRLAVLFFFQGILILIHVLICAFKYRSHTRIIVESRHSAGDDNSSGL